MSALETFSDWLAADRDERARGLEECLARIRERDPSIRAWAQVRPQPVIGDGPLAGIPFGVKDIVETRGMATEYGSPLYKDRIGREDAAIVRELRGLGAVLLGKTVTTPFAYMTPGPTRNPRDLSHTPGGSSSGSAAAVAAGMVPFTVGTQTRGSVIRPASFCGVTGFKPTYGLLSMEGVLPFAPSLDTPGLFTHTPADMVALWETLGKPAGRSEAFACATPDPPVACEPEMAHAFGDAISLLRRAGVPIASIDIADLLTELDEANTLVTVFEGARSHAPRLEQFGDELDERVAMVVREGLQIPVGRYEAARRLIADSRPRFAKIFGTTPIILTPAAPGAAPSGLSSTGDPRMNAPWTALGTPAVSIPLPVASGLPLGLQLTADAGEDSRALRAALFVHQRLLAGPKLSPA